MHYSVRPGAAPDLRGAAVSGKRSGSLVGANQRFRLRSDARRVLWVRDEEKMPWARWGAENAFRPATGSPARGSAWGGAPGPPLRRWTPLG